MNLKKTLQIRRIGQKILEGPRSILPPDSGDDWLEKEISIYTIDYPEVRIEEISLWSDSTMNKENNFLKPLIRFAHWERKNDLQKGKEINFPDIRIFFGYIDEALFDQLNDAIVEIQTNTPRIVFKPLGINFTRDVANIETSNQNIDFKLYIRNGLQSLDYYSPFLKNDTFSTKVSDLKKLMLKSMKQISMEGWKERYDSPFNTESFDWNFDEINGSQERLNPV